MTESGITQTDSVIADAHSSVCYVCAQQTLQTLHAFSLILEVTILTLNIGGLLGMGKLLFLAASVSFLFSSFEIKTFAAPIDPRAELYMKSLGIERSSWYYDPTDRALFEVVTEPSFLIRITAESDQFKMEFPIESGTKFLYGAAPTGNPYRELIMATLIQRKAGFWLKRIFGFSPIMRSETLGFGDKKIIDIVKRYRAFGIPLFSEGISCHVVLSELAANQGTRQAPKS